MNLYLSTVCLLFMLICCKATKSELTTIDVGYGFTENDHYDHEKCVTIPIHLNWDESHDFLTMLRKQCQASDRTIITGSGKPVRSKRYVQVLATAGMAAAVGYNFYADWKRTQATQEELKLVKKIEAVLLENSEHFLEQIKSLDKRVQENQFDTIGAAIFGDGELARLHTVFKLDTEKTLKQFGYDVRMGTDILNRMPYTFLCGASKQNYEVEVCGNHNPSRMYGLLKMVAPIGGFIHEGQVYSYFDSPRLAVFGEKAVSVEKCEKFGNHYACSVSKGQCSIEDYKKCPTKEIHTRNGLFTMELGDATFIASTEKHYYLQKSGAKPTIQKMPASGHMLLRVPHDTSVKIGDRIFHGRHDRLETIHIESREVMKHLDHAQIRKMVKNHEDAGHTIHELEEAILHNTADSSIWDTIHHFIHNISEYFNWIKESIVEIAIGIVALFVLIVILKCVISCCCCCCRKKKGTSLQMV